MQRRVLSSTVQKICIQFLIAFLSIINFHLEFTEYINMVTPLEGQAPCHTVTSPLFHRCAFRVWEQDYWGVYHHGGLPRRTMMMFRVGTSDLEDRIIWRVENQGDSVLKIAWIAQICLLKRNRRIFSNSWNTHQCFECTWARPLCFSAFNCTPQGKLTEHVAQLVPDHHQALGEPRKVTTMADEASVILPQQTGLLQRSVIIRGRSI